MDVWQVYSLYCYQKPVAGAFVRFSKLYHGVFRSVLADPLVGHFLFSEEKNTREEREGSTLGIDWAITEIDSKAIRNQVISGGGYCGG